MILTVYSLHKPDNLNCMQGDLDPHNSLVCKILWKASGSKFCKAKRFWDLSSVPQDFTEWMVLHWKRMQPLISLVEYVQSTSSHYISFKFQGMEFVLHAVSTLLRVSMMRSSCTHGHFPSLTQICRHTCAHPYLWCFSSYIMLLHAFINP